MSDITEKRNACFYDISEIVKIPLNNNGYVNRKSLVKVSDNSLRRLVYLISKSTLSLFSSASFVM